MSRLPEPESAFQAEGVPDMGYTLEEKEITGDAQEGMDPPRDQPLAVDEFGTTALEEVSGEPLDLRLSREEPEVLAAAGTDADESEGSDDPFRTPGGVGRLVEPDEGARTDTETDAVAADVGTDAGGFSAEEAAMHVDYDA